MQTQPDHVAPATPCNPQGIQIAKDHEHRWNIAWFRFRCRYGMLSHIGSGKCWVILSALKQNQNPAEILANQHSPVFEKTIQGLMAQSQSSTGCQNSPESVEAIWGWNTSTMLKHISTCFCSKCSGHANLSAYHKSCFNSDVKKSSSFLGGSPISGGKLLGLCGGNWSYTNQGYSFDSLQIVPMQHIFH